jgi:hypothetical protein
MIYQYCKTSLFKKIKDLLKGSKIPEKKKNSVEKENKKERSFGHYVCCVSYLMMILGYLYIFIIHFTHKLIMENNCFIMNNHTTNL